MAHIELHVGGATSLTFHEAAQPSLSFHAERTVPDYHGEYEITPTLEEQTLATAGMRLGQDVVINPIPSNYGLITWDGSILTVS